jgi:superfamily II DNA or RNA helicase
MELTRGVVDSPPRSGKTVMMAELVRQVADTTVITAPTVVIAQQTHEALVELLFAHGQGLSKKAKEEDFALLTGGPPKSFRARRKLNRAFVVVCTADTAAAMSKEWWRKVRCLMVDERHHQAALKTYGKINDKAVEAFWRWGFTGTNFRSNPAEQVALEACLGRVVARYSIQDMLDRGVLVPGRVEFRTFDSKTIPDSVKFDKAYPRGVVRCDERNTVVVDAALCLKDEGRRVLVLVRRIEHGERLEKLIPGSRFVQAKDKEAVRRAVRDLSEGTLRIVIGSPVVGEGLDMPGVDALVYAKGYKARVTHTQDTFRVLTGGGDKKDAVIVDFVDRHNVKLFDHSLIRMRNYLTMLLSVSIDNRVVNRPQSNQLGFGL